MTPSNTPWPCPVCAELLPGHLDDCPHCRVPAAWLDLMLALGFTIRQFHYWSVIGSLGKEEYRGIMEAVRRRQDEMTRTALAGQAPPTDTGLPSRTECCRCRRSCDSGARVCAGCGLSLTAPEVRLFRYKTFLSHQIQEHAQAGRLGADLARQFVADTSSSLAELQQRIAEPSL